MRDGKLLEAVRRNGYSLKDLEGMAIEWDRMASECITEENKKAYSLQAERCRRAAKLLSEEKGN